MAAAAQAAYSGIRGGDGDQGAVAGAKSGSLYGGYTALEGDGEEDEEERHTGEIAVVAEPPAGRPCLQRSSSAEAILADVEVSNSWDERIVAMRRLPETSLDEIATKSKTATAIARDFSYHALRISRIIIAE